MRQVVNILFLGGAKRVAMGRLFKEAGRKFGMDVMLFSYELSSQVPIAEEASVIVGRRWADPDLMASGSQHPGLSVSARQTLSPRQRFVIFNCWLVYAKIYICQ